MRPALPAPASSGARRAAQAGALLRGAVVDAGTGAPVRATVTVTTAGAPGSRAVRSDGAGRFVLAGLRPGALAVHVAAFGYRAARTTVRLGEGADSTLRFVLTALPRVLDGVRTTATATAERAGFEGPAGASVSSLGARELLTVPAVGEPDALRAASLLPGIAARNDLWAGFNVRGGESDQTLVRLDGVPVFSPFHLGGLFSTFTPDAVGEVDARVGALPASYGGRLSGVLDVGSAEERRAGVHGTAQLSVVSAAATLGGSLAAGRGSWNLALRRTYADAFSDLVVRPGAFPYHFQDAQLHAALLVPGGGTLALTAYGGLDLLNPAAYAGSGAKDLFGDSAATFRFGWGNQAAGLAFTQPLGAAGEFVQRVSHSGFGTRYDDADAGARLVNRIGEVRVAGELTRRVGRGAGAGGGPAHTLRAGYELSRLATRYDEHISSVAADEYNGRIAIEDTTIRQRSGADALYAEDAWAPSGALSVRPGVRLERVPAAAWQGVSPRLAVKLRARDDLAFTFAAGRYAQWTHAVRNEDLPVQIVDVWLASDRQVPVSTGTELVGGTELWRRGAAGGSATLVRVEAYAKRFADLVEPSAALDPRLRPSELRRFGGTSRGVDVLVRRFGGGASGAGSGAGSGASEGDVAGAPAAVRSRGFSGWLAYSYGISRREFGAESYYPAHDRRHDLNLVGDYRAGAHTTFGARLGLASGTPYTGFVGTYDRWSYDPVQRGWVPPRPDAPHARNEEIRTARNADRYPGYARLDLSAHRQFRLAGLAGDAYVNVVNVFNNRNVLLYTFDTSQAPPRVSGLSQLPFLPTLGARVAF